jgi:hypothetical protein
MPEGASHGVDVGAVVEPAERARRVVLATQGVFFGALALCVALVHDHVAENDGISYYGVHAETIVFCVAGYLVAAIGLWWVAGMLRDGGVTPIAWVSARSVSVMLVLLLLTPYDEGSFLNWTHMTIGVVGALVQLAASWTLMRRVASTAASVGFWVQLVGGVVGALSLPDWGFTQLLTGEIIFELGYSLCVLEWTRALATDAG